MKFNKILLPLFACTLFSVMTIAQSSPAERMAKHDAAEAMAKDKMQVADYQDKLNRLDHAIQDGDNESAMLMKQALVEIMTTEVEQGKEKQIANAEAQEKKATAAPAPTKKKKKKRNKKKAESAPVVVNKPQPDYNGQKVILQQQEAMLKKIEANLESANVTLFKVFSELMQRDLKATYPAS